jgi:hypothetical protein
MRKGVKLDPERSEAQRAFDQQNYQSVQGELVSPPSDTETVVVDADLSESESASAVASAGNSIDGLSSEETAKRALKEADRVLAAKRGSGWSWVWSFVIGGVGVGSIFAVRQYANKTIPEMPSDVSTRKW